MKNVFTILFLVLISLSAETADMSPREYIFKTDRQVYSLSLESDPVVKADKLRKIINNFTRFIVIKGMKYEDKIKSGLPLSGSELEVLYRFLPTYRNLLIQAQIDLIPLSRSEEVEDKLLYLHNHMKILQSLRTIHKAYFRSGVMRTQIHNAFRKAEQMSVKRDEVLKLINQVASTENQENLRRLYRDLVLNGQSVSESGDKLVSLIKRNGLSKGFEDSRYINIWTYTFFDGLSRFGNDVEYMLSKGFGNIMGEVKFRKGFLYKNKEALAEFMPRLQPLDIIVERSPFALTDMTIPGHWTHPAIWLGTEEQLKDLGLWDHPIIKPFQDQISKGHHVLEAIRPGIEINPLSSYFNTDEILHMRIPGLLQDKERMLAIYQRGLSHVGQKYDFNFDATSTDVVVCSELIFQAFGDINWPVDKVLGRHSITPDNVVEIIFYEDSPVVFVSIFGINEQKSMYELDKDDMMHMMGISLDKKKSLEDGEKRYNKEVTECNVRSSRVRVGSRRTKRLKITKCDQVLKPIKYIN